jgi:hypothetical protein
MKSCHVQERDGIADHYAKSNKSDSKDKYCMFSLVYRKKRCKSRRGIREKEESRGKKGKWD